MCCFPIIACGFPFTECSNHVSADHGLHIRVSVQLILNFICVSWVAAGYRAGRWRISAENSEKGLDKALNTTDRQGNVGLVEGIVTFTLQTIKNSSHYQQTSVFAVNKRWDGKEEDSKILLPVSWTFDKPTTGFHLYIQAPLHAAHLHVLVKVAVHVTLGCGQFQLEEKKNTSAQGELLAAPPSLPQLYTLLGIYKSFMPVVHAESAFISLWGVF